IPPELGFCFAGSAGTSSSWMVTVHRRRAPSLPNIVYLALTDFTWASNDDVVPQWNTTMGGVGLLLPRDFDVGLVSARIVSTSFDTSPDPESHPSKNSSICIVPGLAPTNSTLGADFAPLAGVFFHSAVLATVYSFGLKRQVICWPVSFTSR